MDRESESENSNDGSSNNTEEESDDEECVDACQSLKETWQSLSPKVANLIGKFYAIATFELTMLVGAEVFPTMLRYVCCGTMDGFVVKYYSL